MKIEKHYLKKSLSILLSLVMVFSVFSGLNITVSAGDVLPESAHPYEDDCDETWVITREGAKSLAVTFSEDTYTEEDFDFITLYSADDVEIGSFSGSALADFTVEIPGDTLKIQLTSDSSYNEYGFKVTAVETLDYEVTTPVIPDTSGGDDWEDDTDNVTEDGFRYEIIDNQVTIIGYSGTETAVVIPSEIDGYLVTSIGYNAFSDCTSLTSIEIPNSVTSIGGYAFYYCTSLISIEIPDSVTSIGDDAFYYCTSLTSIEIPDSVTSIGGYAFDDTAYYNDSSNWENGVLYIGKCLIEAKEDIYGDYTIKDGTKCIADHAFSVCKSLTSIEIPNSVTSIGDFAFYDCTSLTSIEIPDSVTSIGDDAFSGCTSLTSIEIPNSVTSIGDYTFYSCKSLTSVTIGKGVTSVGGGAFGYCESLTSVTVDENNQYYSSDEYGVLFNKDKSKLLQYPIGNTRTEYNIPESVINIEEAFKRCGFLTSVTIPDSVTSIGDDAFYYCTSLISIEIPNSVTSIGSSAFSGCTSLTSIEIPDSVTSIGDDAFYYCESLTSIEIPDSVTSIGEGVFEYCSNLTSIEIPDGVTSIGSSAFSDCTSLTSIEIPNSVTSIGDFAFSDCRSLTSIEIPDGVTSIGGSAFYYCTSLTSIEIPDSVTSIAGYAFYYCTSLTSAEIPNSVTSIGDYAFYYCESLTSIEIPDSVTSIGEGVFEYCSNLTSIEITDGVTSIGSSAFSNCTSLTSIEIPDSVTSIGEGVFEGCESLLSITVDIDNSNYSSVDGVMYNKDKSMLIRYPAGKKDMTYTVIDGVTDIGSRAFVGCVYLTDLTIPDSVININFAAFGNCSAMEKISIGKNVESIDDYAFCGCNSLQTITIPASVKELGSCLFKNLDGETNCINLKSINVEIGNTEYKSIDGVLYNASGTYLIAYPTAKQGDTYVVPEGVEVISGHSFYGCENLKTIVLPVGIKKIYDGAFYECKSLKTINLPDSLIRIGRVAFAKCGSLTSIDIPDSVTYIDWGAYRECVSLKNIKLPKNTSVEMGQFNGCVAIETIVIPEGAKKIYTQAFTDCVSLNAIYLPKSIESISYSSFVNCTSLKNVYYEGSESEWNEISVNEYQNENFINATKHYNTASECIYGHTEVIDEAVAPTCTEKGLTEGSHCSVCNAVIVKQEIISATGHKYDNGTVTKQPTCTDDGVKTYKCKHCEDSYTEVVNATGHTVVTDIAVNATCTETGLTEGKHCSECGEIIVSQEVIPALGHKEAIDTAVVPTCTETGLTEGKHCSECNEIIIAQEVVKTLGHDYSNGVCTVCDDWSGTEKEVKLKSATNVTGGVKISWSKLEGAEKYIIYRKTSAKAEWKKLYTTKTAASSYTDKTAKSGTKYYYTVKAARDGEYSKYDNDGVSRTYLAVPKISSVANKSSYVEIKWGKVTGASSYDVYRKVKGGSWKKLDSTKSTTFKDKTAKAGKVYEYKVRAKVGKSTTSEFSSVKKIVRLTTPKLAKVTATKGKVTFTFGKVTGAEKYYIYRKTGSGSYKKIATVKSTKYVDKSVKKGTTYTYTVKAVKSSYSSAYSSAGLKVKAK